MSGFFGHWVNIILPYLLPSLFALVFLIAGHMAVAYVLSRPEGKEEFRWLKNTGLVANALCTVHMIGLIVLAIIYEYLCADAAILAALLLLLAHYLILKRREQKKALLFGRILATLSGLFLLYHAGGLFLF